MKNTIYALLLSGGLLAASGGTRAEGEMTFRGTLIEPPPCTINDGELVDVDFGDRVGINKIDGTNYRREVQYQIECGKGSGGSIALTLSLKGTASGFDKQALSTNKSELGIRIYRDDEPFTPGSVLNITLDNPPRLEAVPVKKEGAVLSEGAFEAWATLQADYQ